MSEYKRLTRKDENGRWVAEAGFYGIYLDNVQPKCKDMIYGDVINRLAELEDKIESGELAELPKKEFLGTNEIGEKVYMVTVPQSYLFAEEQYADNFIEKEREKIQGTVRR